MDNTVSEMDAYALGCIRCRVCRLVGRGLIQQDEIEDFSNNIYCGFLRRSRRFDPSRGHYSTFASCVVRNLIASAARTRIESRRRYSFTEYSETALVPAFRAAQFTRSTIDAMDLRITVRQAVATLPENLRWLANALSTESLTEISERTGKLRSSLYLQRAEIRSHFERLGIGIGDRK